MTRVQQTRRKAFTSLVLVGTVLLGGLALTMATTASPAGALASCGSGLTTNTAEFSLDTLTYSATASPDVQFTIPGGNSPISWTLLNPTLREQVSVSMTRFTVTSSGGVSSSTTTLSAGTTSVATFSSGSRLVGVVVCTRAKSTSSSTTATTAAPSQGDCPTGQVENVIARSGNTWLDVKSPTIKNFAVGTTKITWDLEGVADQMSNVAVYSNGAIRSLGALEELDRTVPGGIVYYGYYAYQTSPGTLMQATVCTTPSGL